MDFIDRIFGYRIKEYRNQKPKLSFTFDSLEDAEALQTQLNMTSARYYILEKTESFDKALGEFITNYK